MIDDLFLVKAEYKKDNYGIDREVLTERMVYCEVESVTRSEFFNAGRNGLNPEFVCHVYKGDYEGEVLCVFRGRDYSIYRVYETDDDYIELYIERRGGSNGKTANANHD